MQNAMRLPTAKILKSPLLYLTLLLNFSTLPTLLVLLDLTPLLAQPLFLFATLLARLLYLL